MRELQGTRTFEVEADGPDGAPELLRRCASLLDSDPDATLLSIGVEYVIDMRLEDGRWVGEAGSSYWSATVTVE